MIQDTDPDKVLLLGAPLSSGSNIDSVLEVKLLDLQALCTRLQLMPRHDGIFLLSNIISMPRLLYTLRTAPCMNSPILPLYDELLRSSLALLANVDLTQFA